MPSIANTVARTRSLLQLLREYLGASRRGRQKTIANAGELRFFLDSRASHVTQISLYGYLRTRAGSRFPELFESDSFAISINIAKWQIWLACLSDIAVYTGGVIAAQTGASNAAIRGLIEAAVDATFKVHGIPADAGPDFAAAAQRVRTRVAMVDWSTVEDGPGPFVESPEALVAWAPVVDEFKELDGEIVKNSVRFRWTEIRQALRDILDAEAVMASAGNGDGRPADQE